MFRSRTTLLVPLLLAGLSISSRASTMLMASLSNSQENPPTVPTTASGARPASSGSAVFVLNDAMTAMTFTAMIFNIDFTGTQTADLNDNLLNAHIHAGPNVSPTTNGPVVWGFIGMPFNDNNPMDVVVTPFTTMVGGMVSGKWDAPEGNGTTLAAQLPDILAGRAYINFHTVQFTGGEIRGNMFVVPTAIPEPSSMVIAGTGTLTLIGLAIRRRRTSKRA